MKINILLIAAFLSLLTACTKEESEDITKREQIEFHAYLSSYRGETRVGEIKKEQLLENGFRVTAIVTDDEIFFENKEFRKEGSDITSGELLYWPTNISNLTFFAWSPISIGAEVLNNDSSGTDSSDGDTKPSVQVTMQAGIIKNFSPAESFANQDDLVVAYTTVSKSVASDVSLYFTHALSEILISAVNNGGKKYQISGVCIGRVNGTGTLTVTQSEGNGKNLTHNWGSSNLTNYMYEYDSPIIIESYSSKVSLMNGAIPFLIPQDLKAWNGKTDIEGEDGDNEGAFIAVKIKEAESKEDPVWKGMPIPTDKWESGNRYIYTLDFTNGNGLPAPDQPRASGAKIHDKGFTISYQVTPVTKD